MVAEDEGEFNYDEKVKRDRLDGDRFDPNGACVDMEQRNLQLIC